jgi:hypothetical protein
VDIVASRFSAGPEWGGGFAGELTRLNCERQFKPFVYLNGRGPQDLHTAPSRRAVFPAVDLRACFRIDQAAIGLR